MIFGTGIDIVEVFRVRDAIAKWGDGFLRKVFTETEIEYATSRRFAYQHYAARFAAKEAVIKAFGGIGANPVRWTDIEIINNADGKPEIKLRKTAATMKKDKKISDIFVSMSHSKNYAVANVILTKSE